MKSPTDRTPIRQEDIDQVLYEEFQRDDDSPSTDSDKTVRLTLTAPQSSINISTFQLSQESQGFGSDRAQTNIRNESENSMASPLSQASQFSTKNSEEQPRRGRWQLQFKKPPGISVLTDGPIPSSTLENDLSMDDYMVRR